MNMKDKIVVCSAIVLVLLFFTAVVLGHMDSNKKVDECISKGGYPLMNKSGFEACIAKEHIIKVGG